MSGFELYGPNGEVIIDSDSPQMRRDGGGSISVGNLGWYFVDSLHGGGYSMGTTSQVNTDTTGKNHWIKLGDGQKFLGLNSFMSFSDPGVQYASFTSSRNAVPNSGGLDVCDGTGALIWSAASAGLTPRIVDWLVIPPGHDLQNSMISKSIGTDKFFYPGGLPGYLSDDGVILGLCGVVFRMSGGVLSVCAVRNENSANPNVKVWNTHFRNVGYRIPIATIA